MLKELLYLVMQARKQKKLQIPTSGRVDLHYPNIWHRNLEFSIPFSILPGIVKTILRRTLKKMQNLTPISVYYFLSLLEFSSEFNHD